MMKKPLLLLAFLLCIFTASAQNFEGTWKGTMIQDSPVVRINFEMVLEQKEGKISGYLYRLFIVDDSLIYNTVRVTARVADSLLIVEDEESVSRNFEERANRKIKATYFFTLNPKQTDADTLWGKWTTSRFKNKYMSVNGKVTIRREIYYETTQLFKRLEEKQLHTTIAFVPKQKAPDLVINKPANPPNPQTSTSQTKDPDPQPASVAATIPEKKDSSATIASVNIPVKKEPEIKNAQQQSPPVTKQPNNNIATNTKVSAPTNINPKKDSLQTNTVSNKNTKPAVTQPDNSLAKNNDVTSQPNPKSTSAVSDKPVVTPPAETLPVLLIKTDDATIKDTTLAKQNPITTLAPPVINNPVITKRDVEIIQTLNVFEDSITISLYDNGEIDGDIVSVFMNNEKIINNITLKASAYKHTVYIKQGESVQLTFFAENLGTIPPNSGLLIVYSGDQRYQVFFTSTLEKSAVVVLKRE